MFVDASVLTTYLSSEPDAQFYLEILEGNDGNLTSSMAIWETVVAVARNLSAPVEEVGKRLDEFLHMMKADIVPITAETGRLALDAHRRFGKGRHPAKLNLGDCFAYASAREHGVALLYKGDDFRLTDIRSALA